LFLMTLLALLGQLTGLLFRNRMIPRRRVAPLICRLGFACSGRSLQRCARAARISGITRRRNRIFAPAQTSLLLFQPSSCLRRRWAALAAANGKCTGERCGYRCTRSIDRHSSNFADVTGDPLHGVRRTRHGITKSSPRWAVDKLCKTCR
jgi:hypothetical protein